MAKNIPIKLCHASHDATCFRLLGRDLFTPCLPLSLRSPGISDTLKSSPLKYFPNPAQPSPHVLKKKTKKKNSSSSGQGHCSTSFRRKDEAFVRRPSMGRTTRFSFHGHLKHHCCDLVRIPILVSMLMIVQSHVGQALPGQYGRRSNDTTNRFGAPTTTEFPISTPVGLPTASGVSALHWYHENQSADQ